MNKILSFLQTLVTADRTPVAAAIIGGLTVLAAKFGFKMNGSDVAYLSAGVTAALGMFVHAHFAVKAPPTRTVVIHRAADIPASVAEAIAKP